MPRGTNRPNQENSLIADPRAGDFVIPIMGQTGAGKSTFINHLFGRNVASVGHDLESHTAGIQHYVSNEFHRRIVILDTPGFDDTRIDDREIMRRISAWLKKCYANHIKLAGIIYLHEISQARWLAAPQKNLHFFEELCGPDATKNTILATTKWGEVPRKVGEGREKYILEDHWKQMLDRGSSVYRFEDSQNSAKKLVESILKRSAADTDRHHPPTTMNYSKGFENASKLERNVVVGSSPGYANTRPSTSPEWSIPVGQGEKSRPRGPWSGTNGTAPVKKRQFGVIKMIRNMFS